MDWCVSNLRDAREGRGRSRDGGPLVSHSSQNRTPALERHPISKTKKKLLRDRRYSVLTSAPYTPMHREVHTSIHMFGLHLLKERTKIKLKRRNSFLIPMFKVSILPWAPDYLCSACVPRKARRLGDEGL